MLHFYETWDVEFLFSVHLLCYPLVNSISLSPPTYRIRGSSGFEYLSEKCWNSLVRTFQIIQVEAFIWLRYLFLNAPARTVDLIIRLFPNYSINIRVNYSKTENQIMGKINHSSHRKASLWTSMLENFKSTRESCLDVSIVIL